MALRYFSRNSQLASLSSGAQSSFRQFFRCGIRSLYESSNWSWSIISFSIIRIMLMIPAFLIFIWGFPTFHWIEAIKILLINCSAMGFRDYLMAESWSMNSIKTKVSILIYKSLWGFIMYSRICKISGRNVITSLWQFLTMVSNLKRSFEVLVQFTYYFFEMILFSKGPTWLAWS